jgi:hypothetical protein
MVVYSHIQDSSDTSIQIVGPIRNLSNLTYVASVSPDNRLRKKILQCSTGSTGSTYQNRQNRWDCRTQRGTRESWFPVLLITRSLAWANHNMAPSTPPTKTYLVGRAARKRKYDRCCRMQRIYRCPWHPSLETNGFQLARSSKSYGKQLEHPNALLYPRVNIPDSIRTCGLLHPSYVMFTTKPLQWLGAIEGM